jgi:hypothetical protein
MLDYWRGKLDGIKSATTEIIRGVSHHYENERKKLPENVSDTIDKMRAQTENVKTAKEKCGAYDIWLWNLGSAIGEACWQDGHDAGQRWTEPQKGKIRIDLSVEELMQVSWLAHCGFQHCMNDQFDGFENKQNAEKAQVAIGRLEFHIPREMRGDDPHAQSFNRQTMIWGRWP